MKIRLRHIAEINPSTPEFEHLPEDASVPFLPLEAVWPGSGLDLSRRRPRSELSVGYTRFRDGDILLPKITPTFQADRSVIARGVEGGTGAATTEVHVIRVRPPADVRYIRYCLASKPFLDEGQAAMTGVAGQQRVPDDFLRNLQIAVDDPARQRAIADFLDRETARIDALIEKKRRMVELLEERVRSLRMQAVLADVDPLAGTGALPTSRSTAALGAVVTLHRGFDLPDSQRLAGPIPVVSSGGVSGSHSVAMCKAPGVVTGRYGTVGEVFYVEEPFWPLNTTLFVSDFRGNDPRWAFYLLASLPLAIDAEKSAVTGINRNVVRKLRVPLPPRKEQARIASMLDDSFDKAEQVISRLRSQAMLLAEHRQALITAAVTGQLDISGAAA